MLVVAHPHHQLAQPGAIAGGGLAEPLLDPFVHEDAVEMRHLGGEPQQGGMLLGEDAVVDAAVVRPHQRAQARILALRWRETRPGLAFEPDVGVEPDLMAGMARWRRTAARLADVADIERRLAGSPHLLGQSLDEVDGDGLSPIAIAADADRFVARSVERQGLRALQAARRVEPDRLWRTGRRRGGLRPLLGRRGKGDESNDEGGQEGLHSAKRTRWGRATPVAREERSARLTFCRPERSEGPHRSLHRCALNLRAMRSFATLRMT